MAALTRSCLGFLVLQSAEEGSPLLPDKDRSMAVEAASPRPPSQSQAAALMSGAAYIATSSALILFNKHALSSFAFGCPNSLLFFHCLLGAARVLQ